MNYANSEAIEWFLNRFARVYFAFNRDKDVHYGAYAFIAAVLGNVLIGVSFIINRYISLRAHIGNVGWALIYLIPFACLWFLPKYLRRRYPISGMRLVPLSRGLVALFVIGATSVIIALWPFLWPRIFAPR